MVYHRGTRKNNAPQPPSNGSYYTRQYHDHAWTGCRHYYGTVHVLYKMIWYCTVTTRYLHGWLGLRGTRSHTKIASRLLKLCPVADLGWKDKRIHLPRIWNFHYKSQKLHNLANWSVMHWIFWWKISDPIVFLSTSVRKGIFLRLDILRGHREFQIQSEFCLNERQCQCRWVLIARWLLANN